MELLTKLFACLACLTSWGGEELVSSALPNLYSSQNALALLPRVELVESPGHLPPAPDPIVMNLDETDIDEEEEPGKVDKSLLHGPFLFDPRAALACLPLIGALPDRSFHQSLTVALVRRC